MLQRIWSICCSLKLAIIITSIATVVAISGSLLMHFNPDIFGNLDAMTLSDWTTHRGGINPLMSGWFYLTGLLVALLALSTVCCFIDWLFRLKARWRKTGEYLIHIGFVLIVIAYFWGSFAGTRSSGNTFSIGQTRPLESEPGHYLRLDAFKPVFNAQGRPVDMLNTVSLLKGDQQLMTTVVKTNTPLIYNGVTVVPASFGQETLGYKVTLAESGRTVTIAANSRIKLQANTTLDILKFYSDALQVGDKVVQRSSNAINPAILIRLTQDGKPQLQGWIFLRNQLPDALQKAGFNFIVQSPITRAHSVLTINSDPGLTLALIGSIAMTIGVCFALVSFYYKRNRGDRPDII